MRRNLTTAADGNLWSAWSYEYRLEKYDSRGNLLTVLERDAAWFPARDPSEPRSLAEDGPREAFVGLVEDDEGIVKTLVALPGENWRAGLGERELQPGFEEAGVYWNPVRDYDAVYGFAIEVIDTRRGELLYRERYDGAALGWVDGHHFATYDQDEHDIPIIEIHRVEFRDPR